MNNFSAISVHTPLPWVSHDFAISTLFLVLLLLPLVLAKLKRHTHAPLPPGPTPWPIIGNLLEIWKNKPTYKWIHSMMEQLDTDIACIRLANVHVIPVTSPEILREILKKHDSVFASRPLTMASAYPTRGYLTAALAPWGDQWKKMRKFVASHILKPATLRWLLHKRTQEADNVVRFIYNQCTNGGSVINLRLAIRQYAGNVIRRMMFDKRYFGIGKEDGGPGDDEQQHVESLLTVIKHLFSFALSDYAPWLRPLDLDGHEKIVSEAVRIVNGYHDPIIDERVQQWREGRKKEPEDLLDIFISAKDSDGKPALSLEEIKAQCFELMLGAVDNPTNNTEWAMAEMINQPEILQKAVEEIDSVVGKDRLVQEADIQKLNYIKACAKEAFRLHPVDPFSIPHLSTADTTVAGYFIPKGSHVLFSRYGLGRNPKVWDEPLKFKPERHLKEGCMEVDLTESTELRFIIFSAGRRGCMGVNLGSEMTIMLLARLIQGFEWKAEVELSEMKDSLSLAKPLHAAAKPRLPAAIYAQLNNK